MRISSSSSSCTILFLLLFFFSFIYDTKNEWRSVKSKKKNKKIKMWIQNHWLWLWNKQTNKKKVNAVLNVSNHVCMCQQKKNHKAGPSRMPYTNIFTLYVSLCFTYYKFFFYFLSFLVDRLVFTENFLFFIHFIVISYIYSFNNNNNKKPLKIERKFFFLFFSLAWHLPELFFSFSNFLLFFFFVRLVLFQHSW